MTRFWVLTGIALGILDFWCHRTHRITITKTIVATMPEWVLYVLIAWFLVHMHSAYHRLT